MKNDCVLIRNAVILLEQEKDNLRQAVRKLKVLLKIFDVIEIPGKADIL